MKYNESIRLTSVSAKFLGSVSRYMCGCIMVLSLFGCKTHSKIVKDNTKTEKSIVVLYENDVHCSVDGYPKMAGLRDAIADTAFVQTVSCGDFIQGAVIGAISKGDYIIDVMNRMNYDAVTLGNHEFDFKIPRLQSLMSKFNGRITCTNFITTDTGLPVFDEMVIKQVGGKKIAYIGVVTPTVRESMAIAFEEKLDETGRVVYDITDSDIYSRVQKAVDKARAEGCDYVIVLSHLSEKANDSYITSHDLIAATRGIDVVLDGHSHSVVSKEMVRNLDGKEVPVTQTGTQFNNVGKLLILPNGSIDVQLIKSEEIGHVNADVQAVVDSVKILTEAVTNRIVGRSDVDLLLKDNNGREYVRFSESNTGNLVTDAFRIVCDADICILNAGSIRNAIKAGELTYGDLMSLLPYDNWMCTAEVTAAQIIETLKLNIVNLPYPDGQFPLVSGMQYTVDARNHEVSDVKILNKSTGTYEDIDMNRTYTIASTDYAIINGGLRKALADAKVLRKGIMHYCDCFVTYFTDHLHGRITDQYALPEGRITVVGLE